MRRHCCKSKRIKGFVLLYTLWLLLGGVALFATLSSLAVGRARGVEASMEWLRSTAAGESAVHDQMFRLVVGGKAALTTTLQGDVSFNGVQMRADIVNINGLVDLNAANDAVLGDVFSAVGSTTSNSLLRRIRGLGKLQSYAQLGMLEELDAEQLACLLHYVTLSSGKPNPEVEFAPGHVRLALNLSIGTQINSAAVAAGALAGTLIRIDIHVLQSSGSRRRLLVEALVTGRIDRPVSILEWYWLPAASGQDCRRS